MRMRMLAYILSFLYLALYLPDLSGQAGVTQHLKEEIDKIIAHETDIDFDQVPGFMVGIVDGDSTYHVAFGSMFPDSLVLPTDSTLFEIGGLTKVFTALLANLLMNKGFLSRDDAMVRYLPEQYRNPLVAEITCRQLLQHFSGLPSLPSDLARKEEDPTNRYADYGEQDLLSYVASIDRKIPTGRFGYAHTNYALLEVILEQATGTTFDRLLATSIFEPLEMTSSTIYLDHEASAKLAPGYDRAGSLAQPWTFSSFAASEGLKSTSGDLCRFVSHVLSRQDEIASAFRACLQSPRRIPGSRRTYVNDAWHEFKNRKYHSIYLHSGKTQGHAASIHFVRETRTAVILLTNSPGSMDGLATHVLRMINYNWKRKANGEEK